MHTGQQRQQRHQLRVVKSSKSGDIRPILIYRLGRPQSSVPEMIRMNMFGSTGLEMPLER